MKRIGIRKKNRSFSLPATLAFLLLALLIVAGGVMAISGMLKPRTPAPRAAAIRTPPSTPSEEPARAAAAVIVAENGRLPTPTADVRPVPAAADATPAPSSPTPMTPIVPPAFTEESMAIAILGFDAVGKADAILAVSIQKAQCAVLSLPRNTLVSAGKALSRHTKAAPLMADMRALFPVQLTDYVRIDMAGMADCVDALGGVELGGRMHTGAEAADFLEAGGSDELLRITRQQELLHAFVLRLGETGFLRLLSAKYTLQKYTVGSLDAGQYAALYSALRRLPPTAIRYLTLPVDSTVEGGDRFYRADARLCENLARELFLNTEAAQ